jgi:hypothetical protein
MKLYSEAPTAMTTRLYESTERLFQHGDGNRNVKNFLLLFIAHAIHGYQESENRRREISTKKK